MFRPPDFFGDLNSLSSLHPKKEEQVEYMEKNEIQNINTTALAYVGDAVYEIYVRKHVIEGGKYNVDCLHKASVSYVNAGSQAKVLRTMMKDADSEGEGSFLTKEEYHLAKRARNHKTASKAKNADPVDYKNATAFEALIGYLYLNNEIERLEEIILKAFRILEEKNITRDETGLVSDK